MGSHLGSHLYFLTFEYGARRCGDVVMWLVWEKCGMSLREIGELFGGLKYSAVAQRLRRLKPQDKRAAAKLISKCQNI